MREATVYFYGDSVVCKQLAHINTLKHFVSSVPIWQAIAVYLCVQLHIVVQANRLWHAKTPEESQLMRQDAFVHTLVDVNPQRCLRCSKHGTGCAAASC